MRKITEQACHAFLNGYNFNLSNTQVVNNTQECAMYLWGNKIATRCNNRVSVSLAGWNSNTTRERLRGLGANIRVKKGVPYITFNGNTQVMRGEEFYRIK